MTGLRDYPSHSKIVDVAVAIVMAFAIVRLVDSIVIDSLMPIISRMAGTGADMSNYFIPRAPDIHSDMTYEEARKIGAVIGQGQFIIDATFLFLILKGLAGLRRDAATAGRRTQPEGRLGRPAAIGRFFAIGRSSLLMLWSP